MHEVQYTNISLILEWNLNWKYCTCRFGTILKYTAVRNVRSEKKINGDPGRHKKKHVLNYKLAQ